MATPNEIAGLQQIAVKPKLWRITDALDGKFTIEFSWFDQDKAEFVFVPTQREPIKYYGSLNTVVREIAKVDPKAIIHLQITHSPLR